MAFRFFDVIGSLFQKKKDDPTSTFSPKIEKDGAVVIPYSGSSQSSYTPYYDGLLFQSERELIKKYRSMALYSDCKKAISEIVGDAIVFEDNEYPVSINLEALEYGESESLKKKIEEEFKNICRLLNFRLDGDNIFEQCYIDGKQIYHMIIDPDRPNEGIKELRYIDPRQLQKIREVSISIDQKTGIESYRVEDEYYLYDSSGMFTEQYVAQTSGSYTKIAKKDIVYAHFGLLDEDGQKVVSHLHQAIRPFNQLREMEDSLVIYRLARAPERRVFYIDVGNIQNNQIEQFMRNEMLKYKNDLTYNMDDGETSHRRRTMAMTEDIWIPRKEGSQATSIETLPGGQNLGQIEDIEFFQKKFFRSLNVPLTRLDPDSGFAIGRSSEISRSEVNFSRFVSKLRKQFAVQLFSPLLKTQLVLKGICQAEDFDEWEESIAYDFKTDSHFTELKEAEIWKERMSLFDSIQSAVESGYFSKKFVQKKVLHLTDDEIDGIEEEIEAERKSREVSADTTTDTEAPEKSVDAEQPDTEIAAEDDEIMEQLLVGDSDFKDFKLT